MVAAPKLITKPVTRAFQPKSQPAGQRAVQGKRKAHKDRPKIGRGQYVKAPLLRDKVTKPRWMLNAAVNNPGNALAAGGIGGGAGVLIADRKKVSKADDRKKQTAAGAAIGGGAGHFARVGADYGTKATAERQFKPLTTKGNYGPYAEGPHKPALNKYKRTVKGDVRTKAKMFDENFPKGIPSYRARKLGVALNKKPAVAAAVIGAGAVGAGIGHRKVKKNMTTSAFGVDHGEIAKFDYGTQKQPSAGRKVLASAFPLPHAAVAGKKGKKLRAVGNQAGGAVGGSLGGSVAGSLAATALTRGRSPVATGLGASAGSLGGGVYGSQRGLARNTRKGYLKREM